MSLRTAFRRSAWLITVLMSIGFLVALPTTSLLGTSGQSTAEAAVSAGDLIFRRDENIVRRKASDGSTSVIFNGSERVGYGIDVSPDGSQIVYTSDRRVPYGGATKDGEPQGTELFVANSDGSGSHVIVSSLAPEYLRAYMPRWSPDGKSIVFAWQNAMETSELNTRVMKVNANGSGLTALTSLDYGAYAADWSPDSLRIAYSKYEGGQVQIYIMNADGSNQHRATSTASNDQDNNPSWSPDGKRIYIDTAYSGLTYLSSPSGFATTTDVSRVALTTSGSYDSYPRVSGDGSTVYFQSTRGIPDSGVNVFKISSNGGTPINVTNSGFRENNPVPVKAAWPPAPPTNSTVTITAPASKDAYGTRQITIGLSATGNKQFDYGWSTSAATPPNTAYLQTTTDVTAPVNGTLNYLGKYSGSGTTWNGGTQPNADWYLWVRSVRTNGTANAWGTPLKVHIPKPGVWPGVGDSTSSGLHLDVDQPGCVEGEPFNCHPTNYQPNDSAFSWVTKAVANVNSTLHLPAAWEMKPVVIARSGARTSEFGKSSETPGTQAWTRDGQAGRLSNELYTRYDSWNIMSMTGGANDKTEGQSNFTDVLTHWYVDHAYETTPYGPWAVPSGGIGPVNCPNSEAAWQNLQANNLNATITSNLQAMVTVAKNASPGVRVIDVDYPYLVNSGTQTTGNPCYSDWNINGTLSHGIKSAIDVLHNDHAAVTGSNVKHVDLRSAFGTTNTVTNGYLQLTRLYGYPHWSSTGQTKAAQTAAAVATGTGW